jgi:hypothetical protein
MAVLIFLAVFLCFAIGIGYVMSKTREFGPIEMHGNSPGAWRRNFRHWDESESKLPKSAKKTKEY